MAGESLDPGSSTVPCLQLRLARNDAFDSRSFCDLFNSLYSRKVDERYYSWQFFNTPFPTCHAVATDGNGAWIGCFGCHLIPSAANLPPIGWMIDLMIAPAFRGKGVFRKLSSFLLDSVAQHNPAALCALSNDTADRIFAGALGWNRVAAINTFTRSTDQVPARSGNFECQVFSKIDASMLATISQQFRPPLITCSRSVKFLRWRFADNPWYRYEMVVASKSGRNLAALVMKTFRDPKSGDSCGDIVDVFWALEDPVLLRDLLSAALKHFNQSGIRTAATWLQTNTLLDSAGQELGFTISMQNRYYNCRILDGQVERLRSPENSFLTMAATDLF